MIKVTLKLEGIQKVFGKDAMNSIVRSVATSMKGVMGTRIHEEGKAADGGDIGQYNDTNPLYVNPKNAPRSFPTAGKTGKTKFANGQQHQTGYFGSYKKYRAAIGRNVDRVNLALSGQMQNQFTVIATERGWGLGWPNTEFLDRAKFFENNKYKKKIWDLTESESQQVTEIINTEFKRIQDAIS